MTPIDLVLDVRQAAAALGLTPRQLKQAISAGVLPGPDSSNAHGFALSGFSEAWMQQARDVKERGPRDVERARYTRRVVTPKPAPGVKEVPPAA